MGVIMRRSEVNGTLFHPPRISVEVHTKRYNFWDTNLIGDAISIWVPNTKDQKEWCLSIAGIQKSFVLC